MREFVCSVCGYVYDEAKGIPEAGITPGTRWEDLPDGWVCPLCGATKAEFALRSAKAQTPDPVPVAQTPDDVQELNALQLSALCSNLARGCEKQYKAEEAEAFQTLAKYFKSAAPLAKDPSTDRLVELIAKDLAEGLPAANARAAQAGDRGALRALTWNEKVSKILKSLLARYAREGDNMLTGTGVYVCTICGFVFVGSAPPALCPVCKAPDWKFQKAEGRAS
ncbi:MAG TPA: rubredoxin [Candidatus Limiplasma sp.]|nr:rubredoxin [Candidatus Limiplasma sp.]